MATPDGSRAIRRAYAGAATPEATAADEESTTSTRQRGQSKPHLYSEESLAALQSAINSLLALTKEDRDTSGDSDETYRRPNGSLASPPGDNDTVVSHGREASRKDDEDGSYSDPYHVPLRAYGSPELPRSPVFAILKAMQLSRTIKKQHWGATSPLAGNPWAQMLAEPIRLCTGSGARLPRSLFTEWGIVKHPTEDVTYLLPRGLADMESLRSRSRSDETNQADRVGGDADGNDARSSESSARADSSADASEAPANGPSNRPADTQESSEASTTSTLGRTRRDRREKINMLTDRHLIDYLTHQTTANSAGERKPLQASNAVQRLVPLHLRLRWDKDNAYARARQDFGSRTGRTIGPDTDRVTPDLKKLRWQPEVADRVLDLMRLRVVLSIQHLLDLQDFTDGIRASPPITAVSADSSDPLEWETAQDIPASDASPDLEDHGGTRSDLIIFLHLSPNRYPSNSSSSSASPQNVSHAEVSPALHNLTPPILPTTSSTNSASAPLFCLLSLLGSTHLSILHASIIRAIAFGAITAPVDVVRAAKRVVFTNPKGIHESGSRLPAKQHEAQTMLWKNLPVMLAIRSRPRYSEAVKNVVREVWALWRYVGGRAASVAPKKMGAEAEAETETETGTVKASVTENSKEDSAVQERSFQLRKFAAFPLKKKKAVLE